jgi:cytochrome c oxidase cbb3-type subunit 3
LTDDHWKNVKRIEDIATVIQNGAANGAMPAWKTRLGHVNRVVLTAAYVASLRGQYAPGKKVEGEVIPPWQSAPEATAADDPTAEPATPAAGDDSPAAK